MRLIDYPAFELGWEQKPGIDQCAHDWEQLAVVTDRFRPTVEVERCTRCGVPRCSSSNDQQSPCVDRRHHHSLHIYEDGSFAPLGGYLP